MCSALNLLGIAVLRCVLVYHPQKTKNGVFWKATKIMPIMTWVVSLVWLLPTLVGKYGQFGLDCKMLSCWFINQDVSGHKANPELAYCSAIMVTGIVVFFPNLLAYAKIVDYTKSFLSTNSSAELEAKKKILEKERRLGKMVTSIIISYFIVYLPVVILRVVEPNIMITKPKLYVTSGILANSLGLIDPLVYTVFNEKYRNEVKSLVKDMINFISFR